MVKIKIDLQLSSSLPQQKKKKYQISNLHSRFSLVCCFFDRVESDSTVLLDHSNSKGNVMDQGICFTFN